MRYQRARTREEKMRRGRVGAVWGVGYAAVVFPVVIAWALLTDGEPPSWLPWVIVAPVIPAGIWLDWREGTRRR